MEPNNLNQPAPATPVGTVPPVNPVTQPVMVQQSAPKSHTKMILIVIFLIILVLGLSFGGYYFYTKNQVQQSAVISAPAGSTVSQEFKDLEDEVNSNPLDDVDDQFVEVDRNIQNL